MSRLAAVAATVRTRRLLADAEAAALSARSTRMAAEADLRNAGFRLLGKIRAAVDTTSLQAARAQLDNTVTAERASADEATAARCRACTQGRETAARAPQPTSRDLALLERADKLGLPSIQEQLPGLHRAVAETDETLRRGRAEHEKLVKKVGETRFAIERDVLADATRGGYHSRDADLEEGDHRQAF